jgi:uncharacterized protein (TIGR03437 family)
MNPKKGLPRRISRQVLSTLMSNRTQLILTLLIASSWPVAAQQVFDNTGNNLLTGTYYFREVIFDLSTGLSAVAYGNIAFSGTGTYTISAVEGDTNSGSLQNFSTTGTYSISASGYGFLSNQILGSPIFGLFSNGIFIGSSTESGFNDLFIAAPVASQNAGTLQGSYSLAYISPLVPFDALLQMTPNGAGTIGTVSVSAYQTTATPINQSISGVKYIVSNNAFVLTFPTSQTNAITGQEYLYSSPDGSFVFGGSPQDFDMFVGVRTGTPGTNFGGLYYHAGLDEDTTQLASNTVGIDSYYGSFNANNGVVVGHKRLLTNSVVFGYTYDDSYPQNSNGTYNDTFTTQNYVGGNGGAVRIGVGIGPSLGISVAVQAPNFSGSGVYLNPVGVVNAASSAPFTAGISRGEFITLVGTNIGPARLQVAPGIPFPTTLGGVQVMINNVAAPIYYVTANQISALVPYATTSSVAQIQVINNGVPSNAVTEFVNLTTPGVFTQPAGGIGYAKALHQDFTLVSPDKPAQIGETIAVFLTGLGDVFPSIPDGAAAPSTSLNNTTNTITADVSGVPATVVFAGLAPGLAGLYQVNVTIPTGVTAGDRFLDIGGPDSFTTESLISIAGATSNSLASPTRSEILQRRSPSQHPFQPRSRSLLDR